MPTRTHARPRRLTVAAAAIAATTILTALPVGASGLAPLCLRVRP